MYFIVFCCILWILHHLLFSLLLCLCWAWNNLVCLYYYYVYLLCLSVGLCSATRAVRCFYYLWVKLPAFMWETWHFLHVILILFCSLMSSVQSSARPSPGKTKNLHLALLFLCLNSTVHTLNCSTLNLLYALNTTELFFMAHNVANVDFGNRIFNTISRFTLSLLSVSILYVFVPFICYCLTL